MAKDPNIDIPKIDDTVNTPSDGRAGVFVKDTATRPDGSLHIIDDQGTEREIVDKDYVDGLPSGGDVSGPASSDDNAVARFDGATGKVVQNSGVTIDDSGNIATAGTVDGRDLSVDGAKLDTIEDDADVTDETNVVGALDGATLPAATVAGTDKVVIQDTDDSDNLKTVTAQSIADLGGGGGGDVTGPASSTDNALARFDAATGKVIQNSDAILSDDGDLTVSGEVVANGVPVFDTLAGLLSTGCITGGFLSPNVDTTKFDISDGFGLVVDRFTDPVNPTITAVTWSGETGLTPTFIATENISFVAIDSNGDVIQQATRFTPEQSRDLIVLGTLVHINNVNVNGSADDSDRVATDYDTRDLAQAIGDINVYGNNCLAASTDLTIRKEAGQSFLLSSNRQASNKDPNFKSSSSQNPLTFLYAYDDGSGGVTIVPSSTDIDPDQYDDGSGTLQPIPNNDWAYQYFYWFPASNTAVVRYGVETYGGRNAALREFGKVPPTIGEGFGPEFARTIILVQQGATDLSDASDATFYATGKFGMGGSSGASGDGGSFQDLQETYNNSNQPEIITDSTRGALTLRRGSAADTDNILEVQNGAGSNVLSVNGEGDLTVSGDVDGRDVAADGTKLDTVETNADVTANNAPQAHAASHTDGTDDIQSATAAQKGLATAAQITKLDGIEPSADVTDETNVVSALDGATLPAATVAGTDKVLIQDTDDDGDLKTVTAQSIADLGGGGGGGGGTVQGTDGTYDVQATNDGAVAGNARGEYSVDLCTDRSSGTMVPSGVNSAAVGGEDTGGSGTHSFYAAGQNNHGNTGDHCLIAGANNNNNSGDRCVIGGQLNSDNIGGASLIVGTSNNSNDGPTSIIAGSFNSFNDGNGVAIFGSTNFSNQGNDVIIAGSGHKENTGDKVAIFGVNNSGNTGNKALIFGEGNPDNAGHSCLLGGRENVNEERGDHSVIMGLRTRNDWPNTIAIGCGEASPVLAGSAQSRKTVIRANTTDATPTELLLRDSPISSLPLNIPDNIVFAFDAVVIAVRSDAAENARWTVKGLIENIAGTVTLLYSSVVKDHDDSGAWSLAVQANDTADTLEFIGTGQVAKEIKWVAVVNTVESGEPAGSGSS